MAVENLIMMDVVGKIKYVDKFAKDIFLFNDIQIVDAMHEIDSGRFILPIREENMGELLGFAQLMSGETMMDEKNFVKTVNKLNELYKGSLSLDMVTLAKGDTDLGRALSKAKEFENNLVLEYGEIKEINDRLEALEKSRTAYSYLDELEANMSELDSLENFSFSMGSVTKDNAARLKSIYNSVTSIVFHVGNQEDNEEVFMIMSPKDLEIESNRILKALNFKPIEGFNPEYTETPKAILEKINHEIDMQKEMKSKLLVDLNAHLKENRKEATESFNTLSLYGNLSIIKKYMAFSEENFYFSGWISKRDKQQMEAVAAKYPDLIIMFSDTNSGSGKPPTKLKNNWLFRPFETLVKMYGVPSFNELDPTPFLSITYMFCFGFMFGDVGQGIILALAGLILGMKGVELGKVLLRLGMCSTFFGFMYGSIFGFEELIHPLWLRPFHEINTVLLAAVLIGIVMLFIAYIYSIINKLKKKDIKEGVFGKNGICGFALYASILGILGLNFGVFPYPEILVPGLTILAVLLVFLVLIREPLANYITKRKPLYKETASEYYVESGFELFEMLLGMLSNTLSFIRIGAFALTHVGLFMAFQTLAILVQNGVISFGILIFANIFIIALEGLIVGIQALRLQFYELFSKYYSGDGIEFKPVDLEINLN
ncbi:V-type ATPase 116kDa subunit family protein [uncultured Acetobacterium sp.]|uniref:V-type ATP synthase subunit I n=1 Tax=uncultured Acetobacterium sp. TaxID=217139 RepID=UPI0024242507|nr:V-type ATPase 116kDa subunit family protein [uncultured Acetobacterium sp.]MBU4540886.1 ATPase [Bacillota bacterium]